MNEIEARLIVAQNQRDSFIRECETLGAQLVLAQEKNREQEAKILELKKTKK